MVCLGNRQAPEAFFICIVLPLGHPKPSSEEFRFWFVSLLATGTVRLDTGTPDKSKNLEESARPQEGRSRTGSVEAGHGLPSWCRYQQEMSAFQVIGPGRQEALHELNSQTPGQLPAARG